MAGIKAKYEEEGTIEQPTCVLEVYNNMMKKLRRARAWDDHTLAHTLYLFIQLSTIPYCASSLVNSSMWLPPDQGGAHVRGRDLEHDTLLGAFLHVNVTRECFLSSPITYDLYRDDIMSNLSSLQDGLAKVIVSLLDHAVTRDDVLVYLAQVINKNAMRDRVRGDDSCASSGMFMNLAGVMLRLCEGYFEDQDLMRGDEIDIRYVYDQGSRVDFSGLTTLQQVVSGDRVDCGSEKSAYSLRCELFFMTARVLHLGLVKVVSLSELVAENMKWCRQKLEKWQSIRPHENHTIFKKVLNMYVAQQRCNEIQFMKDNTLIKRAVAFYRMMVARLISLVCGPEGAKLPLPVFCPRKFACIPEHFVDDIIIVLHKASALEIKLDKGVMEDFINFIVMFMPSPEYIRNPHLRVKMVDFLQRWMIHKDAMRSDEAFLLVKPTSVSKFLVRSLLKAHSDMEVLPDSSHFKKCRRNIFQLLGHLRRVDSHRDMLTQIANNEEKRLFLKFLKYLIEETISLLDYSFGKFFKSKHAPKKITTFVSMSLALQNLYFLAETSQYITSPFLLSDMVEEVVNMLNYNLSQLHKLFRLKGTSECGPFAIQLLRRTIEIYVNLDRGDNDNVFPASIIKTDGTYNEHLFTESINNIFVKDETQKKLVEDFIELGYRVKVAAIEEGALGEIPEEFLDPIQYTLMKDPVFLPSSKVSMDRPVISRHLLSTHNDPFTRSYLNVDMLTPNVILKDKIEEFIRKTLERQNKKDTT